MLMFPYQGLHSNGKKILTELIQRIYMKNSMKSLIRNEKGNISIIAAFGVVLLFGVMALSVDHGRNLTNESDVNGKLLALAKKAGDEYSYWRIRKEVNIAAGAIGEPLVSDLDEKIYVLYDASINEATALERLRQFIQDEIRRTNPEVSLNTISMRTNTAGKLIMSVSATQPLKKDFVINKTGIPNNITTISADILINSSDENTSALQFVMSLDEESKTQITDANIQRTFSIMQTAANAIDTSYSSVYTGLMIGNMPNYGPSPPGNLDAVVPGGYDCANSSGRSDFRGFSGTCYDGDPGFNGLGTGTPVRRQTRNYMVEGTFVATDAAYCQTPVWTYLNHPDGQCRLAFRTTSFSGDVEADDPCTPPPPPTPPVIIPPEEFGVGGGGNVVVGVGTIDGNSTSSVPPNPSPPAPPPPPCNPCTRFH
jgi:hypothetical protein